MNKYTINECTTIIIIDLTYCSRKEWSLSMYESSKVKKVLTVMVVRDGKVIEKVTPYSEAPLWGKIAYWMGLKNYTKEIR